MLNREPIAIIGIGCRFPGGVRDSITFWDLLKNGVDAIAEVPADRFNIDDFYDPRPQVPGKIVTRYGGFIDDVDKFDADFFGISPREAQHLDPQQRLLAEVGWEAFEDAGINPAALSKTTTAVYAGIYSNDYENRMFADLSAVDLYAATGGAHYSAAGRLSYLFDLKGPSVTVETACSSSLVAVHLACRSLWSGECQLAMAGGVNLILNPHHSIAYSNGKMLSPEGRCKFGDAEANGFARAEGCGIVLLKRLSKAHEDNDRIYATILGSAINNDGRNGSLVAPSHEGQAAAQLDAYRDAGVSPGRVIYIEAHGTGTTVGDPVEMKSLGQVVGNQRPPGKPCWVGSVKTNFGHAETASGVAGLIKAALCLHHRKIPPSLHFNTPNPEIPWTELNLDIPVELKDLPVEGLPAIAGINSFGLTGMNAHIVLQEFPAQPESASSDLCQDYDSARSYLLPLSAKSSPALAEMARKWHRFLTREGMEFTGSIRDLCYTAGVRRAHHEYRLAVAGKTRAELSEKLANYLSSPPASKADFEGSDHQKTSGLVFVFSGQGPQWFGMGRTLIDREPVFRQALEQCAELLAPLAGWSLMTELTADESRSRLDQTEIAQPAIFALQMGLTALWRSWGIQPGAVVGHSLGEVAAACVGGVLSLEQAVRVVFHRGRLLQGATGKGRMAAVELPQEEAQLLTETTGRAVWIAAVNGPASVTLSGDIEALEGLLEGLSERKVFYRQLNVKYAFHSHQVEPYQEAMTEAAGELVCRQPEILVASTVSGQLFREGDFGKYYWAENIRRPVRFWSAVDTFIQAGHRTFLEIGPHPVLTAAIAQCLSHRAAQGETLPSLRRGADDQSVMLRSLGRLYTLGHGIKWKSVYPEGRCKTLPSYAWHLRRFWTNARPGAAYERRTNRGGQLEGVYGALTRLRSPLIRDAAFEWTLNVERWPLLGGHRLFDQIVLPASAYISVALSAAKEAFGNDFRVLDGLNIQRSQILEEEGSKHLQILFKQPENGAAGFEVVAPDLDGPDENAWIVLAQGRVGRISSGETLTNCDDGCSGLASITGDALLAEQFYSALAKSGVLMDTPSRCIETYWLDNGKAAARLVLPKYSPTGATDGLLHPLLVDGCLQTAAIFSCDRPQEGVFVVGGLDRFEQLAPVPSGALLCHARKRDVSGSPGGNYTVDLSLCNPMGAPVARMIGLHMMRADAQAVLQSAVRPITPEVLDLVWLEPPWTGNLAEQHKVSGEWLIFTDRSGAGAALARLLEALGGRCRRVESGAALAVADRWVMDPSQADHFEQLLARWKEENPSARRGVLYFWGLDAATPAQSPAQATLTSSIALLHLIKALSKDPADPPLPLWIITRGAQTVDADQPPSLEQVPLWGLGRVLSAEHPDLWGGLVDLDPAADPQNAGQDLLVRIIAAGEDRQVALRRGRPYVPALKPADRLESPAPSIDAQAVYLIFGGLGMLGLHVARWLAGLGARRIVLAARTPLPERSVWDRVEPGRPLAERIAAVRNLEAMGVEVKCVSVDMADEIRMRGLLDQLGREGWTPVRGVIHAAAVVRDTLLHTMDAEALREVFRSKIDGAWLLHHLFAEQPPDFMIFFSSLGALLGQAGQGGYAAANLFLDGLARYRRAEGRPALSVNWGAWSGSGLAATQGGLSTVRHLARQGIEAVAPEQATQALGALIRANAVQAVVTGVCRPRLRQQLGPEGELALSSLARPSVAEAAPAGNLHQRLNALAPGIARREFMENEVTRMLAAVLKMESAEIDPEKPFGNLGLDSLMAVELKNRCESTTGLTLSATLAWNHPTVRLLALHLARKMGIALDEGEIASREASGPADSSLPEPAEPGVSDARVLESVDHLSDEEALRQLLGKTKT